MDRGRSLRTMLINLLLVGVILLSSFLSALAPSLTLVAQVVGTPTAQLPPPEPTPEPLTLPASPVQPTPAAPDLTTEHYGPLPVRPSGFDGEGPLGIALTSSSLTVVPGDVAEFTVRVGNLSADTLNGIVVRATLPQGLLFAPTNGPAWEYDAAQRVTTWTVGTMAVGADATQPLRLLTTGVALGQAVTLTLEATAAELGTPVIAWAVTEVASPGQGRQWLVPSGGRATLGNGVRLGVARGHLNAPLGVAASAPPATVSAPNAYALFTLTSYGLDGQSIVSPPTVPMSLSFAGHPEATAQGGSPTLKRWEPTNQTWQTVPSQVDWQQQTLSAEIAPTGTYLMENGAEPSYGVQNLPTLKSFSTDAFTGNSSIGYPLVLPPGPGGLGLNLSLAYSSETVNSLRQGLASYELVPGYPVNQDEAGGKHYRVQGSTVGYGWSLGGLGQVSRPADGSGDSRLTFPGGSLTLKYIDGTWQSSPQQFLRIINLGSDDEPVWRVWTQDGMEYTFGDSSQSNGEARALRWVTESYGRRCYPWLREAHLTEVKDRQGNRVVIDYQTETKNVSFCASGPSSYDRAIYPTQIRYIAAGQSIATARVVFRYVGRDDHQIEKWDDPYVQNLWSTQRLADVWVQARTGTGADTDPQAFATLRTYELQTSSLPWSAPDAPNARIMWLNAIVEHGAVAPGAIDPGRYGAPQPAWTFTHVRPIADSWGAYTLLGQASNGQGGVVNWTYENAVGGSGVWMEGCGGWSHRFRVMEQTVGDGIGGTSTIEYIASPHYNTPGHDKRAMAWTDPGWPACSNFEFGGWGHVEQRVKQNGVTLSETLQQFQQPGSNHVLTGKPYYSVAYDGTLRSDGSRYGLETFSGYLWPQLVNGTQWSALEWQAVKQRDQQLKYTYYDYEPDRQGGAQYGNPTAVWEFLGTDTLATRVTSTFYRPTADGLVTALPYQTYLYQVESNGALSCKADTVLFYKDANGNNVDPRYTAPPTALLGQTWQAPTACGGPYLGTAQSYDAWGNPTSSTDPRGYTTTTTFDTAGSSWPRLYARPLSSSTVVGNLTHTNSYQWGSGVPYGSGLLSPVDQVTQATDSNNNATTYEYDVWARPLKIFAPGNGTASTELYSYADYAGPNSPFRVSVARRASVGNEANPYVYQGEHLFYDGLGQAVQSRSTYIDESGAARHAATRVTYDALGRAVQSYAPLDAAPSSSYLLPSAWTSTPFAETRYDYLGRLTQQIASDTSVTAYRYGLEQIGTRWYEKQVVIDANRHRTQQRIDGFGRLESVVEQSGNCANWEPGFTCVPGSAYNTPWQDYATTSYTYDVADRLTNVTDAQGNLTSISYDLLGRKLGMTDPDMGTWQYRYDAAGNLIRQRDANSNGLCFLYDALNRPLGKHPLSGVSNIDTMACPSAQSAFAVRYYYDEEAALNGRGQRTSMQDPSGSTSWQYDVRGRVTRETKTIFGTGGGTFSTQWSYDALGRVRTTTYPDNEVVTTSYQIAPADQDSYTTGALSSLTSSLGASYLSGMSYNRFGQPTRATLGTSPQTVQTYEYWAVDKANGAGRLRAVRAGTEGGSTPINLLHLAYLQNTNGTINPNEPGYDAVGNVLSIVERYPTITEQQRFSYDERDRLISASATGNLPPYSETYAYDTLGNLTARNGVPYLYDVTTAPYHPHAATHVGGVERARYDAVGNMVWRSVIGTNVLQELGYDGENRLVTVWQGDVQSPYGQPKIAEFVYDGDGNRVVQRQYDATGFYVTSTIVYVGAHYEKETLSGSGGGGTLPGGMGAAGAAGPMPTATPPPPSTIHRKSYYAGEQRVATRVSGDPNTANNGLFWTLTDHLGSTAVTINGSAQKVADIRYDPWGKTRYSGNGGYTPTDRRYTGQIFDDRTSLYFYNARYYDPLLARFTQADALVPDPANPQSFNRYAYVLSNPLKYTDPSGHCYVGVNLETGCTLDEWLAAGVFLTGFWEDSQKSLLNTALNLVLKIFGYEYTMNGLGLTKGGRLQFHNISDRQVNKQLCGNVCENTRSHYHRNGNKIDLWWSGSDARKIFRLVHEMGHAFDNHAGGCGLYFSEGGCNGRGRPGIPGWKYDESTSDWVFTGYRSELASNYIGDDPNPKEDYAEVFAWKVLRRTPYYYGNGLRPPSGQRLEALNISVNRWDKARNR